MKRRQKIKLRSSWRGQSDRAAKLPARGVVRLFVLPVRLSACTSVRPLLLCSSICLGNSRSGLAAKLPCHLLPA